MTDDYLGRLRAAVDDDEDVLAVMWELYPKLREDLCAGVDELERLRAQVASFPDLLADAQEIALDKLVEAFGEGWDNCRLHLEDEARLKRGVAVTQYSNQLPWPTYVAPQRPNLDALCVRDAMADAAMRQPESGAAK